MHRYTTPFVLLALFQFYLVLAQINEDLLPKPGSCGRINTGQFFNNEEITELNEFPWTARLAYTNGSTLDIVYRCSAVLISRRYLITNANCLELQTFGNPHAAVLGDWNTANAVFQRDCNSNGNCADGPQQFDIEDIIVHSAYNNSQHLNNDIALLRLNSPVIFTDYISPICLPSAGLNNIDWIVKKLWITGWTLNENNNFKSKYNVHMVDLNYCRSRFEISRPLERHLCGYTCATQSPSGSKIYMAGSALMDLQLRDSQPHYYYLVGIPSHAIPDCAYPNIFTRIDSYLDWIKLNIY